MDLDLDYIEAVLVEVLAESFPNSTERQKIKKTHHDFNFCCPICGDSSKDAHNKRGHLYFDTMLFRCYNEDCKSSFTDLAKRSKINISFDKKMDIINYIENNISFKKYRQSKDILQYTQLLKLEDIEYYFNNDTSKYRNFKKCTKNSVVGRYLLDRKIPESIIINNIYCAEINMYDKWFEPIVIFINKKDDGVIGIQHRNLQKDKRYRRFDIINYETLYNMLNDEPIDSLMAINYNKFSYLFNILNVNYEKPITLFEGYLDSLFYPNSIAGVGTNTDFSLLLDKDLQCRFFFDNDAIGHKKSLQFLKKGFPVFLWNKLFDVYANKSNNYADKLAKLKEIKDLNMLAQYKSNPYESLKLENYFSTDILDKLYLNKNVYKKVVSTPKFTTRDAIELGNWDYIKSTFEQSS